MDTMLYNVSACEYTNTHTIFSGYSSYRSGYLCTAKSSTKNSMRILWIINSGKASRNKVTCSDEGAFKLLFTGAVLGVTFD
jgi:hypothetical protein